MTDDARTRTITWADPSGLPAAGARMGGLEFLTALVDGTLPSPPIMATMGIRGVSAEPGRVVFAVSPDESLYNPLGTIHGGLVCTILDTALACAGHTTLGAGSTYTSVDLVVHYLRPVLPDAGPFQAVGRVVKPGRRVIFTEGEVTDAAGRVVATATSTLLVMAAPTPEAPPLG